jgi:uncharacterized protein YecE (DUF72 family)
MKLPRCRCKKRNSINKKIRNPKKANQPARGSVRIGTSGWNYKHWVATFYPAGTRQQQQLQYYVGHFDSVEINNSFYRMPSKEKLAAWRDATPENFLFAIKGSRYITHMKKLKDVSYGVNWLLDNVSVLGKKLGPILFQLPPVWNLNVERLTEFLELLPADHRFAIEFRNISWYDDEVYNVLTAHNVAFCIYELNGHLSPLQVTADFVYVRLHGPGGKYQGSYSNAVLRGWAKTIQTWIQSGKDVYVYFDNDQEGYAAFNAETLRLLSVKK